MFWMLLACTGREPLPVPNDTHDSESTCDTASPADTGIQIGTIAPACRCEEPTVIIGTGEFAWEDLDDDAPLTMVHGPQGGWHMLGSARVCGSRNVVTIHFTITHDASGTIVSDNTYRVALVDDPSGCCGHYPGMYGFLGVQELAEGEMDTPPELLACAPVTLKMEVTDSGGRQLVTTTSVTATPDPTDSTVPCP
jgi:hypothetical protein